MKQLPSIILFTFLFSACTGQQSTFKNLNADEFEKGIQKGNIQLVDVRTPQEYADKHIVNSKNININDGNFEKTFTSLDKNKPLYIYCLSGGRSARAAEFASRNDFKEIYNLEGGITAWIGSKKAVEVSSSGPPQMDMSFDDYLNHIKSKEKLVLVDFNAVWCGPCKILKPIVHKAIKRNSDKVELFDVDVDKNPAISSTMHISGIPLLVLYKNGKEVWRTLGLTDEATIHDKITEFSSK